MYGRHRERERHLKKELYNIDIRIITCQNIECELRAEHSACALVLCIEKRTSLISSCLIIVPRKKAPAASIRRKGTREI